MKKSTKKLVSVLLASAMAAGMLAGCGSGNGKGSTGDSKSSSAVYQKELALLLIQASPHPPAYCFSQWKQGTYLIQLN